VPLLLRSAIVRATRQNPNQRIADSGPDVDTRQVRDK
jgi:hypothetical protein